MSEEQTKEALKEALKEWLDDKIQDFGWWTIKTLSVLAFGAVVYLIIWAQYGTGK